MRDLHPDFLRGLDLHADVHGRVFAPSNLSHGYTLRKKRTCARRGAGEEKGRRSQCESPIPSHTNPLFRSFAMDSTAGEGRAGGEVMQRAER
jgi:hypothetical protein